MIRREDLDTGDVFSEDIEGMELGYIYVMNRLVDEGWFESVDDVVSEALDTSSELNIKHGPDTGPEFERDYSLTQRNDQLKSIFGTYKDDILTEFFSETTYLVQQYARLDNDFSRYSEDVELEPGRVEVEDSPRESIQEYFASIDLMLGTSNLPEETVDHFLQNTLFYVHGCETLSQSHGLKGRAQDYEEMYFTDKETYIGDTLVTKDKLRDKLL